MNHDFSIVFDTENELWQRVLNIFAANEPYSKKVTKGRELHHKFPKSFSKKLGEEVDNDEDNLISLTPADHFRVHYYYYMLAKKGYRQPMALAFQLMVRAPSKQISPATMEEMAIDYEELRRNVIVAHSESMKKWYSENQEAVIIKNKHVKESQNRPEVKLKKSIALKGKNAGVANGMYGKHSPMRGHSCTDWMTDEEIKRWKAAISKSNTGRVKSAEESKHISESKMGNKNPMFRKFQWNDNKGHHVIDFPENIADEDLTEYRKILHYIWNNDYNEENSNWRERLEAIKIILEKMEKLNK